MLTIRSANGSPFGDGQPRSITRRRLLEIGGLGMLGLGLPRLLQARAPDAAGSARHSSEKSCILILQEGGPSQLDTWDLKPDAPAEIRGPYQPIATQTPGTQICELMPRLAQLSDRYCIIRSMSHPHPGHPEGMHVFLSGCSKLEPAKANGPYFGSVLAKLRPATRSVLSYVWLMQMQTEGVYGKRWQDGGSLGPAFAPFILTQSDGYNDPNNPASRHYRVKAFDDAEAVSPDRVHERRQLLTDLDAPSNAHARGAAGSSYQRYQERAFDLVAGPGARQAFAIEQEPAKLRARYGWSTLGQNLLLARRLIESGVRLVTVAAHTGSTSQSAASTTVWDMHGKIFDTGASGLGGCLPRFDEAVSALLEDLEARGLLDSTLVLALGEMGRTPKINEGKGRDHWSQSYTAMLAGAGTRGGMVYGASDNAAYVKDNPVSPDAFAATVYHALGVPPETRLGADGFTQPVSEGKPVLAIFG